MNGEDGAGPGKVHPCTAVDAPEMLKIISVSA